MHHIPSHYAIDDIPSDQVIDRAEASPRRLAVTSVSQYILRDEAGVGSYEHLGPLRAHEIVAGRQGKELAWHGYCMIYCKQAAMHWQSSVGPAHLHTY